MQASNDSTYSLNSILYAHAFESLALPYDDFIQAVPKEALVENVVYD